MLEGRARRPSYRGRKRRNHPGSLARGVSDRRIVKRPGSTWELLGLRGRWLRPLLPDEDLPETQTRTDREVEKPMDMKKVSLCYVDNIGVMLIG
jgi:hypothetical protein